MGEKLGGGADFPLMALHLIGNVDTTLPSDISEKYQVVLFYRGHW